jgi:hypothetical protein
LLILHSDKLSQRLLQQNSPPSAGRYSMRA